MDERKSNTMNITYENFIKNIDGIQPIECEIDLIKSFEIFGGMF